jgi:hypothetical protein
VEPRGRHRRFDFWRRLQQGGVECEVGVGRERGDRQFDGAGVQVDGLRADQDHGLSLRAKRIEGIEEDAAGDDVLRIRRARHVRFRASTRSALPLHSVHGRGW